MSSALEKLKKLEEHVVPNVKVKLVSDEPLIDIDYPNERIFISKGKTNVLGELSDVVNRAMRIYPSDDD